MFGQQRWWDLGWLGAIFAVPIVAGVVMYYLWGAGGGADPNQSAIRRYYGSRIGGNVPRDATGRLNVTRCDLDPVATINGIAIVSCAVGVDGRNYRPCYGFDVDKLVSGPLQISQPGCDRLVYDPGRKTFIDAGS
ncbi:MAG TPA: hypothetical protein VHS03_15700 [Gaiellaceae bacterium]|jgi:hypothetical protein|nr:hypothetical protein [Gaiellaceae bacterium]